MTLHRKIFTRNEHHVTQCGHFKVQNLLFEGPEDSLSFLSLIDANEVLLGLLVHNRYQVEVLHFRYNASVHRHAHAKNRILHDTLCRDYLDISI